MIRKEEDGLVWLEFELLSGYPIVHGSFTRHGGCSAGPHATLNVSRNVGDRLENVHENFRRIGRTLGMESIVVPRVIHGSDVVRVDGVCDDVPIADGISTNRQKLALSITHADCQAAIFYDPVKHALANVHCGWRGNVQNIYLKTIEHMEKSYGSKPQDLLVCISPSLGPDSSEFINFRSELPEPFWKYQHRPFFFDLWAISRAQLREAGVQDARIQIAEIDTLRDDNFFSYRREKLGGRQSTICALL